MQQIVNLLKRFSTDDRIAITHGNGPQVGNLLVQQEAAAHIVSPQDFDIMGSMTQGQIGYMFQQSLQNQIRRAGGRLAKIPVISVVNQVLVSPDDPEFLNPTKPIGNFFTKKEAEKLAKEKGYIINPPPGKCYIKKKRTGFVIKQVKPTETTLRPFRRVVPSPEPKENVEGDVIKMLVDRGAVVIASGGGGIPVTKNDEGDLKGVFSVIDKDKAGERLAEAINATDFIILTDIENAMLDFGKPTQKPIKEMSLFDAKNYLFKGHFLPGSMGPKVEACIRFLEWGGKRAIISSLYKLIESYEGNAGTHIFK